VSSAGFRAVERRRDVPARRLHGFAGRRRSEVSDAKFTDEIESLKTLRDELRVQLNLAGKDARDLFATAEKSWQKLDARLRLVGRESKKELEEVQKAARPLAEEIKRAYTKIRELI
jgi:hypothetical protein